MILPKKYRSLLITSILFFGFYSLIDGFFFRVESSHSLDIMFIFDYASPIEYFRLLLAVFLFYLLPFYAIVTYRLFSNKNN